MSTQPEHDEAAIRRRIADIREALRAGDLDALGRLYTLDVVSFDIEPPLQHVGRAAKLTNWANVFAVFDEVDYEVRDLAATVGGDVAFAHGFGRLSGTMRNGTATSGMWVRATFCFRRVAGEWLIAHDQVSVPLELASGRALTGLEP